LPVVGLQQIRLAEFELPDFHPEAPGTDTVFGFLVREGNACILVDTGLGSGSALIDRLYKPRRIELADALAEADVSVREITAIVNTHLHFDHCGNNRLFPGVPIFVQAAELEAAQQPHYTVSEWVDFSGANYVPVRGAYSLSENLELLATPGHTPGHQSMVIRLQGRTDIIVGQAAYTAAEFELFYQRRNEELSPALARWVETNATWSAEAYVASLAALGQVRPDRAFFSHDQVAWKPAV
jgi:glyoxylase-like metal-dependent hydrolase (beta-lactamase superfamily II)